MGTLTGWGLQMDLPRGWDGQLYRREPNGGEQTHPVLHAANFALPQVRGDFGAGAVELMGAGNVFVALLEYNADAAAAGLFRASGFPGPLEPGDFQRRALQRALPGQAGVQRFFTDEGRPFCLYAVLGSYLGRSRLAPLVNQAIAGLSIHPVPAGMSSP